MNSISKNNKMINLVIERSKLLMHFQIKFEIFSTLKSLQINGFHTVLIPT